MNIYQLRRFALAVEGKTAVLLQEEDGTWYDFELKLGLDEHCNVIVVVSKTKQWGASLPVPGWSKQI